MNDREETTAHERRERSGTAVIADTHDRDEATTHDEAKPRDEANVRDEAKGHHEAAPTARPSTEQDEAASLPLFSAEAGDSYRQRWQEVQSRFVDDPPTAVKDADQLIADLMQDLAHSFNKERTQLEETWKGGGEVSTEELRLALRRYRSFFGRLLSV